MQLEIRKNVFAPSAFTELFAKNMVINSGESIIDIGTGSGALAILAAKLGGKVFATDKYKEPIECAKSNAKRNKVNINFKLGKFFAGTKKKFDVVIPNLPQEVMEKSFRKKIGAKIADSSDGGKDGNQVSTYILKNAKKHMHKNSRLYMSIGSMCDFQPLLKKALQNYEIKLLDYTRMAIKEFEIENIEKYKKLSDVGKLRIFKRNNKWFREDYFYELKLK